MATRFVPNPAFRKELEANASYKRGMGFITATVADEVEVAALPFRDTGNYIGRVDPRFVGGRFYVELEKHFAHIMEFGSVNNPPQRNAMRGVETAGLRFEDTGPHQNS